MSKFSQRFRTVYWRQFLLTAIMSILSLVLLGAVFLSFGYNLLVSQSRKELSSTANQLANAISHMVTTDQFPAGEEIALLGRFAGSADDMDLFLYNTEKGTLLTFSTDLSVYSGKQYDLPDEVKQVMETNVPYAGMISLDGIYKENKFAVAVPIQSGNKTLPIGLVLAVSQNNALHSFWGSSVRTFLAVSIIVLVLTVFVVSLMANSFTKPIKEMAQATRRLAQGNFDVRVKEYHRNDEIAELATAFNYMANSLQESDRQTKELIANISHELKTPMTSIAGYTDGILDGTIPKEDETKYLRIISTESRRLNQLVRRMLDISQLQARDHALNISSFDLGEQMRQVLISLEQKITSRGLDVMVEIPEEPVLVKGDREQITQVVYNLLENATKYGAPETAIGYHLTIQNNRAKVSIENLGRTIPAEEIPMLFERFHKVDASRGMDRDGVGLGLAIVKAILDQHHEPIFVTSEDGLTTFSFGLPISDKKGS